VDDDGGGTVTKHNPALKHLCNDKWEPGPARNCVRTIKSKRAGLPGFYHRDGADSTFVWRVDGPEHTQNYQRERWAGEVDANVHHPRPATMRVREQGEDFRERMWNYFKGKRWQKIS